MTPGHSAFKPRHGRPEPSIGDRVRVYRNLPLFKHQVFSIVAMDGPLNRLVLGYCKAVGLRQVTLKVSERTREKVLARNQRTVHAFAEGILSGLSDALPEHCLGADVARITYNPFTAGYFFDRAHPGQPISNAHEVWTWGADLLLPGQTRPTHTPMEAHIDEHLRN